jgi:hypothetical protein
LIRQDQPTGYTAFNFFSYTRFDHSSDQIQEVNSH